VIIVLDSGIWISALHFGGTPLAALEECDDYHQIAICPLIVYEVKSALVSKFGWNGEEAMDNLTDYILHALHIKTRGRFAGVCRDPNDDMVIECAVEAGATVIVTGDKDLLSLREYRGIRMLTAREFVEEFSRAES